MHEHPLNPCHANHSRINLMAPTASHEDRAVKPPRSDLIRGAIASVVSYLELRLRLFGLEFREAGLHLLVLGLLLAGTVVCFAGFGVMLIVFLLYLMMLILHWAWGWSALATAGSLLFISLAVGVIFRARIAKPLFPMTFAELQKDRQWLEHRTKSSR
jgi:uncharacterized membrane protein YqjE